MTRHGISKFKKALFFILAGSVISSTSTLLIASQGEDETAMSPGPARAKRDADDASETLGKSAKQKLDRDRESRSFDDKLALYQFRGKTAFSDTEIQAPSVTLYPEGPEDARRVISLALSQKLRPAIRSGDHFTESDTTEGIDNVTVNLSHLSKITLSDSRLKAQSGATVEEVFNNLIQAGNFALPLSANGRMSIASNVLHEEYNASGLMCSLGSLSHFIYGINAVNQQGEAIIFSGPTSSAECKRLNAVITDITFNLASTQSLYMLSVNFPYQGQEHLLKIAQFLFRDRVPVEHEDLMIDAYNGPYGLPFLRINFIESQSSAYFMRNFAKDTMILGALIGTEDSRPMVYTGAHVLQVVSDTGILYASIDPTITSEKFHSVFKKDDQLNACLERYTTHVHQAFTSSLGKHTSRLQINPENNLNLTEFIYTPAKVEPLHIGIPIPSTRMAPLYMGAPLAEVARTEFVPKKALSSFLDFQHEDSKGPIDNFSGLIYTKTDAGYQKATNQYATSSYPGLLSPYMVAYPKNIDDIKLALKFAQANHKKIVIRSGGHQYSGTSSGGDDTIVLSMDAFHTANSLGGTLFEAGPAVRLTILANKLRYYGITIPHGECPLVAIGGHAQTGGIGHLIHSFGLTVDYVRAFDIVLADGTFRTVTRPTGTPITSDEKLNQALFRGVMGGNAGSFGVVTKYIFDCISAVQHPEAYGISKYRTFNTAVFRELLKEAQQWTSLIEEGKDDLSLKGLDWMMTVASKYYPIMFIELVYSDPDSGVPYDRQFDSIVKKFNKNKTWTDTSISLIKGKEGKKLLSELSDSFVRRDETTPDGREFKEPYKKRVNMTTKALSDKFVDDFSKMLDWVVFHEPDMKIVFQMAFGGGAFREKGMEMVDEITVTSFPHRKATYTFVFDLFYTPGHEATATALQDQMQTIVDTCFHEESYERRALWGTFGQINMSDPAIQRMYYNDGQYEMLQQLKQTIDSGDLFHTPLTVQLS